MLKRKPWLELKTETAKTAFWQAYEAAPKPDEVAIQVFDALKRDEFYILTHPEQTHNMVSKRLEDILSGRNPT